MVLLCCGIPIIETDYQISRIYPITTDKRYLYKLWVKHGPDFRPHHVLQNNVSRRRSTHHATDDP